MPPQTALRVRAVAEMPNQQHNPRRTIVTFRNAAVRICAGIMLAGMVIGLIFFARPSTSMLEKRELTPFPAITLNSFLDGSFFTDVSLWYADTYPLREPMVGAAQAVSNLYGVQPEAKFVGGNVVADEIGGTTSSEEGASEPASDQTTAPENVEAPETVPMQEAMQAQIMNGLYITGGAAYNIYYFVEDSVETYTSAVRTLAESLEGEANVYSILIPNGSAILLSSEELEQLGGSDQEQAIDYAFSRMGSTVHPVRIVDALRAHKNDYLYFRTDHHWTQEAAYLAYSEFCATRGYEPADMHSWESMTFDNFLGTFFNETGDPTLLPDTVTAYIPPATNDITYVADDGIEYETHVINDVSDWGQGSGYYCYGIGDYPLVHVANPKVNDGSACLLLKDSYGNCLAPELIGHYQDLYVIDYRYSDTDIVAFVREHGISDVIVENNIAIASTQQIADSLADQVSRS